MKTLLFIGVLIGFLGIRHRWRGDPRGTYGFPMVMLLVYLFVEYARPQTMHPQLDVVPWGKVTVALLLVAFFVSRQKQASIASGGRRQDILLMAYVGLAGLSMVLGMDPQRSIDPFIDLIKLVIVYFVVTRIVNTEARLGAFIWTLLILNLKLAQHHIRGFQKDVAYLGIETAINRGPNVGIGFLGNSGDFGVAMCVVLPIAFFVLWGERHRLLKALAGMSILTFAGAIYATGSRGAFVGALAAAIVIWLKMPRKVLALAVAALIGVAALNLAPDAYWTKMETIFSSSDSQDADANVRVRFDLWRAGVKMAADNPLTGVGIGNFQIAWREVYRPDPSESLLFQGAIGDAYKVYVSSPHNMFIQALSELGIFGLLLILLSFLNAFLRHRELRRKADDREEGNRFPVYVSHGLDAALVGLAVSGSFLTVLYYPHLWLLLGLSVAVNNVAVIRARQAETLDEADGEEPEAHWLPAR
jgi:putative inorganic carbon (hco3(-)) transporter